MNSILNFLVSLTPDKISFYALALAHLLALVTVPLYLWAHWVALTGTPGEAAEAGTAIKLVKFISDYLAANYGKSKNTLPAQK